MLEVPAATPHLSALRKRVHMAGSYNHITLIGRLTKDPEIRYVQSGTAVCSFSIAVNRKTKAGDEAMFVDCVAWNAGARNLADVCNNYLHKGMQVLVDGRLAIREYTTKDGEKRKATEVVLNDMQMLDSKKDGAGAPTRELVGAGVGGASGATATNGGGGGDFDDPSSGEEIPF
jgi:single-strand DNA-binding protein